MSYKNAYDNVVEAESEFFDALLRYNKNRSLENLFDLVTTKWLAVNEAMGKLIDVIELT